MGTGDARRGRRDNGLVAAEYAVAGDVDPRVGEHLLDVLGAGGIAAYLQPAADLHPVTRTTTIPARPTDRLYVDRTHLDTARDYLAQLAEPGAPTTAAAPPAQTAPSTPTTPLTPTTAATPDAADAELVDTAFAQIVAGLRADLPESGRWPRDDETDRPLARAPGGRRADADEPSLLDGLDTFGADLPDEDEDSYTPPPPPPMPRPSAAAVLSMTAVVLGFVLFLWPDLAPFGADAARLLGLATCAAGVVGLIWRLRPGDEDDDYRDPDHGARV